LLQSIGTIIDTRWVYLGMVSPGTLCSLQGGIKQTGNVGTAVWTFMLSLHAFRLLFLRSRVSKGRKWLILVLGWSFIIFIVIIGPLGIREKSLGPYFGPSGYWCWITEQYPASQICQEYMLEWMSAFFSFMLYVAVLLRVRGNLIQDTAGKWSLRWIARGESWQLGSQEITSTRVLSKWSRSSFGMRLIHHRVLYTVLIVPISIARFAGYAGAHLPVAFTFLADLIFALGGFANLMHFLSTRRYIPDLSTMPDLSTPRSRLDRSNSSQTVGITPFTPLSEGKPGRMTTVSDGEVTVSCSEDKLSSEKLDPNLSVSSLQGA
ncbi:hypothetical protein BGY98DRAFT_914694, partial [Russula aff. rugulosa BPL654]